MAENSKGNAKIHRLVLRLRSGTDVSELENMAYREYKTYAKDSAKQDFLLRTFLQGYALTRAGVTGDANLLFNALGIEPGFGAQNSDNESSSYSGQSTVNKNTQQKLGGLMPCV